MSANVTRRKLVVVHTLLPTGEGVARQLVRCPRQSATLSSDTCMRCPRLSEVQMVDGELAALFCDGGSEPVEDESASPLQLARVQVESLLDPRVTCVRTDMSLDAVMAAFVGAGREILPVVDAEGQLQGLVSEQEVQLDIHARAGDAHEAPRCARDVMVPWPLSVPEQTPLTRVAAVLAYERQHHVAVVSAQGALIGVVSCDQILSWLAHADGYLL